MTKKIEFFFWDFFFIGNSGYIGWFVILRDMKDSKKWSVFVKEGNGCLSKKKVFWYLKVIFDVFDG